MQSIFDQIDHFNHSPATLDEVFSEFKKIREDIYAHTAFGDIKPKDSVQLRNLLDVVVKNKLSAFEPKQTKPAFSEQPTISEIFVQKTIIACQNTKECIEKAAPIYNMGVMNSCEASDQYAVPRHLENYKLISTPQGVVPVLHAVSCDNGIAGHDWVTFSFSQSTLAKKLYHLKSHETESALTHVIENDLDPLLHELFGFGIGKKREKGMHFYKYSFELQDNLGLVLYGHSSKRISIQINGTGCSLARKGWQNRLYNFLNDEATSPKLNRVDLAFDDFESQHLTLDLLDEWYDQDLFWTSGVKPDFQQLGNWKRITGKGRTINIGNRTSGKFARFYERGKKEGDSLSLWVRAEVEFKSTDRHIPLDILLAPSQYFKGAYPALEILANKIGDYSTPEKPEIVKKQSKINCDKALEIMKLQFGKYIRQFRKFIDDTEFLNLISSDKDEVPKRLEFSHAAVMQSLRINEPTFINSAFDVLPLFNGVSSLYKEFDYAI